VTFPPRTRPYSRRVQLAKKEEEENMKGKRYSEEQIIRILKEKESGITGLELCRRYGMSEPTLYKWQKKYGGLEVNDAMRLKALENENSRLKKLVADLSLDKLVLEDLLRKNF
jgi:putative transposase